MATTVTIRRWRILHYRRRRRICPDSDFFKGALLVLYKWEKHLKIQWNNYERTVFILLIDCCISTIKLLYSTAAPYTTKANAAYYGDYTTAVAVKFKQIVI
jgi:hypothetical protein